MRDGTFDGAMQKARQRRPPVDAIRQVERAITRVKSLFEWGDMSPDEYLAESGRLRKMLEELKQKAAPQPAIPVAGILDAWRTGDPLIRRKAFGILLDALHVENGQIVSFTPREDRRAAVEDLVREAIRAKVERQGTAGQGVFAISEREGFEPLVTIYRAEFG